MRRCTLTVVVLEVVRWWCLIGLWYAGMDLRVVTKAQYDCAKQRLVDHCKALHVFDGSRTAMTGIRTAYIERDTTRR